MCAHTTRLNTTANGPVHLGHAFMALINEALAHASGGRFIVRFEDSAICWQGLGAERLAAICAEQRRDLEWLELPVDLWQRQSALVDEVNRRLREVYNFRPPADADPLRTPRLVGVAGLLYPYTPTLTAQKVVFDYLNGVNLLVRGVDLLSEFSLYQHYCWQFGLPEPEHVYLPRLHGPAGDISKTTGGYTLAELRAAGYTPGQVRDRLGRACLVHAPNGWSLDNLRTEPRLSDAW